MKNLVEFGLGQFTKFSCHMAAFVLVSGNRIVCLDLNSYSCFHHWIRHNADKIDRPSLTVIFHNNSSTLHTQVNVDHTLALQVALYVIQRSLKVHVWPVEISTVIKQYAQTLAVSVLSSTMNCSLQ